jgi:histidine ammonia-lyase
MDSIKKHLISPQHLSLKKLFEILGSNAKVALSAQAIQKISDCRTFLDNKMKTQTEPIYGINTGFGSLYNVTVKGADLARLQENLVRSHACGTGAVLEPDIVKIMLFLKAQSLAYGHSGVRVALVEKILTFYNLNILPKVFEQGSLGASGDLAPLAHVALALMGEGEVFYKEGFYTAKDILKKEKIEPTQLVSKEGLALLNGTQFMLAIGCKVYFEAQKLLYLANVIASLSLEGYDGRPEPFDLSLHYLRNHNGQVQVANTVNELLQGSKLIDRPKEHVQDPYSFRCIPQVHGASYDLLAYVAKVLTGEINAVTDNPTIFPEEDKILSGGNFHGQTLALALDSFALAMAELGNISERRTYLLISGQRGLPPFLVKRPGLNSGLMIAQYTAASVVSQNKQYCTPSSVDSIVSSNGQEDHVSMGANAATKALKVVENLKTILAIEIICASQALSFRKEATSPVLTNFLNSFRSDVPLLEEDRVLSVDIENSRNFIDNLSVDADLLF